MEHNLEDKPPIEGMGNHKRVEVDKGFGKRAVEL